MTTNLLETLRALAPVVTPGEWSYVRNPENTRWIIDSEPAHAIACTAGFEPDNESNANLIVALRNNLPAIIAALEVAELVRDEDWLVDQIRDYFPAEELAVGEHIAAAREIIAAMGEEVK